MTMLVLYYVWTAIAATIAYVIGATFARRRAYDDIGRRLELVRQRQLETSDTDEYQRGVHNGLALATSIVTDGPLEIQHQREWLWRVAERHVKTTGGVH